MGPCFLNILHWVKILCKRRRRIRVSKWLRGWKVVGSDRSCWFWDYFFTIFLALKKGEGVSAALLAIFLRKKGSDSPFFVILFTECHCR